jgi:hypothetical protein
MKAQKLFIDALGCAAVAAAILAPVFLKFFVW